MSIFTQEQATTIVLNEKYGNRGELSKQIGNAVPVKLAEASGKYFQLIAR